MMNQCFRNVSILLIKMQDRAHAEWIISRILFNLQFYPQSIWNLQQSLEKYLKVLWSKDRVFANQTELSKMLKDMGHNLHKIYDNLPDNIKSRLNNPPLQMIPTEDLRYGEKSWGYSAIHFNTNEKCIRNIRRMLGEDIRNSYLKECDLYLNRFSPYKRKIAVQAMKRIFSLPRQKPTKKERIKMKRILEQL